MNSDTLSFSLAVALAVIAALLYNAMRKYNLLYGANKKLYADNLKLHAQLRQQQDGIVKDIVEHFVKERLKEFSSTARDMFAFNVETRLGQTLIQSVPCTFHDDTCSGQATEIQRCDHCGSHKGNPHSNSCKGWDKVNQRCL